MKDRVNVGQSILECENWKRVQECDVHRKLTLFETPGRDQRFGPRGQASQFAGDVNFLRGCRLLKS